ncbi:ATP-dependent RNA helicase RhlE [Neorhizobium huautlense]|uniref:ATP-dependent RNA helicase RhlE n=1 Tax=Neorhizobium huautlense TaxID=67774 RepID=A0ABT9PY07_9HYPH|nr:DEAD/DEAH box helicase [Neorhizobium huautlense]MDP9839001.1 ATP-dependent RNA helicase RhlE [Neorhizobium huautlense]
MTNFETLGVSKQIVATLSQLGIETPTPIQEKAIPLLLEGRDLIGLAQTGTGKTAAFGLPLIERLLAEDRRPDNRTTRSLILAPTRELVNQIAANLKTFIKGRPLKINLVVGGVSINKQQLQLEKGTDILVATPGRLLDLVARRAIGLTTVRFLVLDEADQMLDLGFVHDLRKIAKIVPKKRQTMLFSATMPKAIADLAAEFLTDPVKVEVTPPGKAADKVEQYVHFVAGKGDKTEILRKTLLENPDGRSIVFMRTKHTAEKLMKHFDNIGFSVASIHGNKSQGQRERALKGFRDGEIKTLIATDVAARGIDIPAVSHVYNYDLPEVPDAYVHRIGRTARAGRDGIAIAFCAPDETMLLRDIEKLMGIEIATASGERPEAMIRPARGNGNGNNKRGGQSQGRGGRGNGGGEGRSASGETRKPRRERPARQPFGDRANGEAGARSEERAERPQGGRPARPARRNEDFRGQRREEAVPQSHGDNDLASTSDFRPKKQFGSQDGNRNEGRPARNENRGERRDDHRKGGQGKSEHAAHGAHEPGAQRNKHRGGQGAGQKQGEARGPVRFGNNGGRNEGGMQGRKRRPA